MHAGLLLLIELLWPDFIIRVVYADFFLPIEAYINPSSLISIIVCIEQKKCHLTWPKDIIFDQDVHKDILLCLEILYS